MASALPIPGLNPGTRFGDAAAATVEVRTTEVFAQAHRVLDVHDIEGVHDMRVATRRLRAALEVFAGCFPKKEHRKLLHEVKALADVLGERRDPDVGIAALEQVAAGLAAADRPGIDGFAGELRAGQEHANGRLAEALDRVRDARLEQRLLDLAGSARRLEPPTPVRGGLPA